MGDAADSDSSDEFSLECFRVVRLINPGKRQRDTDDTSEEGADAVYARPTMAAEETMLLPDPPPRSESDAPRPPVTPETIFYNYTRRRGALVRALTQDEEEFFQKCDPSEDPLLLYGGTDENWEVKPPVLLMSAGEPQPKTGINVLRDMMERHQWLLEVAAHCDAWLINISSFFGSCLTATERDRLFNMIHGLPTVQETLLASDRNRCMEPTEAERSTSPEANEVVEDVHYIEDMSNEVVQKEEEIHKVQEKKSTDLGEANVVVVEQKEYFVEDQRSTGPIEANEVLEEAEEDATSDDDTIEANKGLEEAEEDATSDDDTIEANEGLEEAEEDATSDDDDNNFCACCNDHYNANGFWICCNSCGKWYHGKCVNITSSQAEHIEIYECPDCYFERTGDHYD